jgi:hypothetical protein
LFYYITKLAIVLFKQEGGGNLQEMASYINSCLGSSKNRYKGMMLRREDLVNNISFLQRS